MGDSTFNLVLFCGIRNIEVLNFLFVLGFSYNHINYLLDPCMTVIHSSLVIGVLCISIVKKDML